MAKDTRNEVLDERIKNLDEKCNHLCDQISEIRTIIQEIYGEMSTSERALYQRILELSSRLENSVLNIHKIQETPSKKDKINIFGMDFENLSNMWLYIIIGIIGIFGFCIVTFSKLQEFLSNFIK